MAGQGSPRAKKEPRENPPDFLEVVRAQLDDAQAHQMAAEHRAADYLDQIKRLQADLENLRKMTRREIDSVTKRASEALVAKLLPVLDALHSAVNIGDAEKNVSSKEVQVGLRMLLNQLRQILSEEGLEEIESVGNFFNPERHEVATSVQTNENSENLIVEEVRKGYVLGGRVIRPSLVIVTRRGAGAPTATESKDSETQQGAA